MSQDQAAAVAHLGELRKQAADPTLDHGKREAIMQKMSELSRHAFLGAKAPAWYGETKPDARDTSNEEHDPLADALRGSTDTLTQAEHDQLVTHGKVQGLAAEDAHIAAD